ncbi:ribonuclease III [Auriscalpium vulgare]|uniref:Ribonuclease III n=1 Tax=Auriscalpium vulgare TaxID=40419 RepID=A0ACB8SCS2_9AGAM|nr:ribonuclease III [Auriscalpium vulgare]
MGVRLQLSHARILSTPTSWCRPRAIRPSPPLRSLPSPRAPFSTCSPRLSDSYPHRNDRDPLPVPDSDEDTPDLPEDIQIQQIFEGLLLMSLLKPDFGPAGLPALPPIRSDDLRLRVFTHRSFAARPTHVFEDSPDDPSPDNEMLEHLGDQVLGLIVTELLQELFPDLRVGPCTKIRALVVGNSTLATIAVKYHLPESLRLHVAQSVTLKASTNVQADVFESYVGGLYKDQGIVAVSKWIRSLFRPYVIEAYHIVRRQHGLPPLGAPAYPGYPGPPMMSSTPLSPPSSPPPAMAPVTLGHLGLFNQRLQQEGRTIEWVYTDSVGEGTKATPVWVARAMINNDCWGVGRGNTKKAAKNEAAKLGLKKMGVDVEGVRPGPAVPMWDVSSGTGRQ